MLDYRTEATITNMGGRIDYEKLEENLSTQLKHLKSRAERTLDSVKAALPQIEEISFDFIDEYSFNAFATGINNKYFIGINRGVVATMLLINDRFFADKNLFTYIGNPQAENQSLPKMPNITLNYAETVSELPFFSPPIDPVRRAFARSFTELTLDFILAHEITHIVNGHVDFLNHELRMITNELNMQNSKYADFSLIIKAMEMDADSGATTTLLSSEIGKVLGKYPRPFGELYTMPGMVFLQFSFVISTLFRIFGDQRLDNDAFHLDTYPKPRLRFVISMLKISTLPALMELNQHVKFDLDKNNVPITIAGGFNIMEEAFNQITGIEASTLSIEDAWGEIGFSQINILRKFWNDNLMGRLQKYSYVELEPYPELL